MLHRVEEMVFDDAAWLSASVHDRMSLHFVAPELDSGVARRVGVRSLREVRARASERALGFPRPPPRADEDAGFPARALSSQVLLASQANQQAIPCTAASKLRGVLAPDAADGAADGGGGALRHVRSAPPRALGSARRGRS